MKPARLTALTCSLMIALLFAAASSRSTSYAALGRRSSLGTLLARRRTPIPWRVQRLARRLLALLLLLALTGATAQAAGPGVEVVSADGYHTCALTPNGAVDCWGNDPSGEVTDQPGPYTQVSTGFQLTCALTPSGAVDCS